MYTKTKQRGFTLVETLFYLGGLVLLLLVIVSGLVFAYDWYRSVTVTSKTMTVGLTLADKIVKEIRTGQIINYSDSTLSNDNGAISVTSASTTNIIKKFSISSNRIVYTQDNGSPTFLSPAGVFVTRFYIKDLVSTYSSAVKFDIDIAYATKLGTTTKTFSGFSILRQSYE